MKTIKELRVSVSAREGEQERVQERINLLVKLDLTHPRFPKWYEFWKHSRAYCPDCGLGLKACGIRSLGEWQDLYTCECGYEWATRYINPVYGLFC